MSFDIYFVAPDMRDRWNEALEGFERDTISGTSWTDPLRAEWNAIEAAALDVLPNLSSKDKRLRHPTTFVELAGYPGQNVLTVSYSSGPKNETVSVLTELARIVEATAGLVAYDPQTSAAFLDESRRMASASRLHLEHSLMASDSVGGTSGMYAFLTKAEVKELRSTKGDPARRTHVDQLVKALPSDRLLIVGHEWKYLYTLCKAEDNFHDLFSGQSMHKGSGHAMVLLKDLETTRDKMSATSSSDIATIVRAFSDKILWHYHSYLDTGTAKMSDALAERVGMAWGEIHASFGHAIDHDLFALFICNFARRAMPAPGTAMIMEKPSPPRETPVKHEPFVLRPHPLPEDLAALLKKKDPGAFTAHQLGSKAYYRASRNQPLDAAILFEAGGQQAENEFASAEDPQFDDEGRHQNQALNYWARAGVAYTEADRFDLARALLEHAATSDWVAAGLSMDMAYADRAKAALADHGSK